MVLGRTLFGPHTDKYTISFNNKPLRGQGSQGEHKLSFVLLKVSEHGFIKKKLNKTPTLLLDDLFAKLDLGRGNAIFDLIKKSGQTIITNTDLIEAKTRGINTKKPKQQRGAPFKKMEKLNTSIQGFLESYGLKKGGKAKFSSFVLG